MTGKSEKLTSSSLLARLRAFFLTRTFVPRAVEEASSVLRALAWPGREAPESYSSAGGVCSTFGFVLVFTDAGWSLLWLLWMRACLVSSSEREKRFSQPGCEQRKGFSPV